MVNDLKLQHMEVVKSSNNAIYCRVARQFCPKKHITQSKILFKKNFDIDSYGSLVKKLSNLSVSDCIFMIIHDFHQNSTLKCLKYLKYGIWMLYADAAIQMDISKAFKTRTFSRTK